MKSLKAARRQGISFVEVLVAVLVVAASAVPVVYMVTSSRTDTSKAINYLRAVELANEVIEWAQGVKNFDELESAGFSTYVGTLADDSTGSITPVSVGAAVPENSNWATGNFASNDFKYSEQYGNAFFFREVEFEDVIAGHFNDGMMKKMTVRVKWNEGVPPSSLYNSERDRQVELSVLLLNDANMNY